MRKAAWHFDRSLNYREELGRSLFWLAVGGVLVALCLGCGWRNVLDFLSGWEYGREVALAWWHIAAVGLSLVWVEGIRVLGRILPKHYRPRPETGSGKTRMVAVFHGLVERIVLSLVAIPFFNPALGKPGEHWPNAIVMSGLLVAATLYVTTRVLSRDFTRPTGPGLSFFSLWNLMVSVGLGFFGGWVYWGATGQ